MNDARKELRAALANINVQAGTIVEGVYSSRLDAPFDVENVVVYNVGAAAFRNLATNGLRARRCRLHDESESPGFPHRMDYRVIPTPEVPKFPAVRLAFTPKRLRRPFDVWWAASNGHAIGMGSIEGPYGVFVQLGGPRPHPNPAETMKVLFDGIIASMQRDEFPDVVAVERLAQKHDINAASIEDRLINPILSVIQAPKPSHLVRRYRESVQWYPADDLCEECTLVITSTATPTCTAFVYPLT